ncbi:MAG: type II secretion system F family protein [Planctomycetes bacterium]|nr:type II secretion system F family protein [Planctomycetota bacterium]
MGVYEIFIPFLVLIAVIATGGAVMLYRSRASAAVRMRFTSAMRDVSSPETLSNRGMVQTIERAATAVSLGKPSPKLREELARAGYFAPNAASVYLGLKTLIFLGSLAGLTAILLPLGAAVAPTMGAVLLISTLLSFVPNVVLSMRRSSRAGDIRRHLPDALDLLEICVSSGMGLDTAWNSVADEVRGVSPALADEMALTSLQLRLGASRSVAMRTMAERTGVDDVSSLVAVLVQSERFGTSISEALRTFAASMRDRRSQNAAEAAEKTAVKLLFPMVIFIFPTVFVVTAGPAAIQLYRMISGRP